MNVTGLGGNRVSVQSSRQCTSLHICGYPLGTLPDHTSVSTYLNPFRVFCAPGKVTLLSYCDIGLDSKVAIVILFGAAPFNMFFVILIFLTAKNAHFTWTFVGAYILFAFVQIFEVGERYELPPFNVYFAVHYLHLKSSSV
uniref:Uncharacterized protein n=1 Tax=Parascaris equorum TaxID=6256 RepID=A0A914RLX6_PAREQ